MSPTRRDFLKTTAALAGAASLGSISCNTSTSGLRILVLGGTGFIGPHMVQLARDRGHVLTLFNRGQTNADLFPNIETLIGDRDGNLTALEGRTWDVVIDNSGYVPRHVRDSAQMLSNASTQYIFVSSISAYRDLTPPNIAETYPVGELDDPTVEQVTNQTYGPLKAMCEHEVQTAFPTGATIIRPGYIVGPRDNTDRFTYWPVRVEHGGDVLASGSPMDPVQIVDARDLVAFIVRAAENQIVGTFNVAGPATPTTFGELMAATVATVNPETTLHWVPADFLTEHSVSVPIWNPTDGAFGGLHLVSNAAALSNGLTTRPPEETLRDTLAWWKTLDTDRRGAMQAGLRRPPDLPFGRASLQQQMEQEALVLSAWAARSG